MDFGILGALEVTDQGREPVIASGKQRALLAILLLHANKVVSSDRLIEELWGGQPPATAAKSLQVHVSRLRKALGAGEGPIATGPNGYSIRVAPDELDLERFTRLAEEGRLALRADDPERGGELLREALSLWRGPPLADFAFESFAQLEISRLEELRLAALEDRIDADLARGQHAELVGELEALVAAQPLRERLRRQLVLALYRAGRQADALEAYRAARAKLMDELGLEPTPELRQLEQAILTHDVAVRAPAAPAAHSSALPAPTTRTIGRDGERDAVSYLLRQEGIRLVTLTGPGGVGKTRLALVVARLLASEFRDGAWFVSLAATSRPEHVPGAIAQAVGVTAIQGETPEEAVRRFLGPKGALLVLDNLEHLLPAAPALAELLAACGGLTVLATSREPLRLRAERAYAVDPLEVPEVAEVAEVERAAAGALFAERARSLGGGFEVTADNAAAVAAICRRLDGLPLAIELAAARTSLLDPVELNARLARALDALGRGPRDAPDRHRTLRATLDWSHRLLSETEVRAFARFAVFAGGATLDAAQQVAGADLDTLESLVAKQLLHRRGSGSDARLLMLETVREYALERLETDSEAQRVRESHCRHYLALAERAEPQLYASGEGDSLRRLDAERENLRAALQWSLRGGDPTLGLRLAILLNYYWDIRSALAEGIGWLREALDAAGDEAEIGGRARALCAQVNLVVDWLHSADARSRIEEARALAQDALALARESRDPGTIAQALLGVAWIDYHEPLPQQPRRALAEEALANARSAGDERLVAFAVMEAALALQPEQGAHEVEQAAALLRDIGGFRVLVMLYSSAAVNAIKVGDLERALGWLDEALPLAREHDDPLMVCVVCGHLGHAALLTGDLDRARRAFAEHLELAREHRFWVAARGLAGLAAIEMLGGDLERAARLLGAATATGPWDADADMTEELEQKFFSPARATCGERRWREAYDAGARLDFEQSIALGLGSYSTHS